MKLHKHYLLILILFVATYALLTFSIPPDPTSLARYGLSELQSRLISLTIVVPLVFIWWAAFYGFAKLRQYVELIETSKEGKGLRDIANGLTVLAFGLPISTLVSSTFSFVVRSRPEYQVISTLTTTYLNIIFALVAFVLIAQGAKKIVGLVKGRPTGLARTLGLGIFALLGAAYLYALFASPLRQVTERSAAYYMSDLVLFFSVAVPYLVIWFNGLMATIRLFHYRNEVKGKIYKSFLSFLSWGVVSVILSSIFLQLLTGIGSVFTHLSITALLILVYVILIMISVGYILIAIGAKKLRKIEVV